MLLGEPISYFLFELLGLALFIVCLHYASKHRHLTTYAATNELIMFFIYGFCLEVIAVRNNFYSYGVFRFQVLETPLVIASGWAVIGFSVMWFSDALNSPEWVKPFSDAMLALLIDLSMDTIAIRDIYGLKGESSGMWNWGIPFDSEWFGVPYGNLISWWVIVFLMSSSLRLGRYANRWFATRFLSYTYPIFAMVSALLVFLVLLSLFVSHYLQ